jgi:hypothetical protein
VRSKPRYNRRSLKTVTPQTGVAVSLDDVKAWIVDPPSADDALIQGLIDTSVEMVKQYLGVSLLTEGLELRLDGFPGCDDEALLALGPGVHTGSLSYLLNGTGEIELPFGPVQSVTSIKAYLRDNSEVTVDPAIYSLDGQGCRIWLNENQIWPVELRDRDAVRVEYVAGYGAGNIPKPILQAIKQHVLVMYEARSGCELPGGSVALLAPYKRLDLLQWA